MPENITMDFVLKLMGQVDTLTAQNKSLNDTIIGLNRTIEGMQQTQEELLRNIAELKEQLNKNSKNSSKPPSSDGLKKPPVKKDLSLRGKSGKKQGGQDGHDGTCLSVIGDPDQVESHMHSDCSDCPHREACLANAFIKEKRYDVDAKVQIHLTEHQQIRVPVCPLHGDEKLGAFPEDIKAPVQYGKNLQALVVALNTVGAVSINRTHEILSSVFDIPLSTGTIKNMVIRFARTISDPCERIRKTVADLGLIHCDETGSRVDGKTCWVHNASNKDYTHLTLSHKRGQIGMEEGDVLPHFQGIIVHDCWESYWKFPDVTHALCCAHLLRELNGVMENHPEQTWASRFKSLLLQMKKTRDRAVAKGKESLSYYHLHKYDQEYDAILQKANEENPLPEKTLKKRGRRKKTKVQNLISRLERYKASVCLFVRDFVVPFDNNQAERDLRMVKVKTKVSGCFRSEAGAKEYLSIMSYVGTAKKHGINSFEAIKSALNGNPNIIFG